MNKAEITEFIKCNEIFRAVEEDILVQISQACQQIELPIKKVFIEQDDIDTQVFLVVSGLVRVFRQNEEGSDAPIFLYGTQSIIGGLATFIGNKRSASAETVYPTQFLVWKGEDFKYFYEKNTALALNLAKLFAKRLHIQAIEGEIKKSHSLSERALIIIKHISDCLHTNDINITQEDLAHILGVTRPRLTETLLILQSQNKIQLSHKKITLF